MTLEEHRKIQRSLAIFRDGGRCMMCKWTYGIETSYQEVHHVFGRGTSPDSIKEFYTSLMCVCQDCHPAPILLPPTKSWQDKVLEVWKDMNFYPLNKVATTASSNILKNPVGLPYFNF